MIHIRQKNKRKFTIGCVAWWSCFIPGAGSGLEPGGGGGAGGAGGAGEREGGVPAGGGAPATEPSADLRPR